MERLADQLQALAARIQSEVTMPEPAPRPDDCPECGNAGVVQDLSGGVLRCKLCRCTECARCDDGWERVEPADGYPFLRVCPECRARRGLIRRIDAARIPAKYVGYALDRLSPEVGALVEVLEDWARPPIEGGFWLTGGVGTGKTTLAVCALKRALRVGYRCRFLSVSELLGTCWRYLKVPDRSPDEWIRSLAAVRILVLDELGKWGSSELEHRWVHDLIDTRYRAGFVTCATSNFTPAQVERSLGPWGPAVRSRLEEMSPPILVRGHDRRRSV